MIQYKQPDCPLKMIFISSITEDVEIHRNSMKNLFPSSSFTSTPLNDFITSDIETIIIHPSSNPYVQPAQNC